MSITQVHPYVPVENGKQNGGQATEGERRPSQLSELMNEDIKSKIEKSRLAKKSKSLHENDNKLHKAAVEGDVSKLPSLVSQFTVNCKSSKGLTALHLAAQAGHSDMVEALIGNYSAAINATCASTTAPLNGKTALHFAAEMGHAVTVKLLLEKGADYQTLDCRKRTALHLAASWGHEKTCETFFAFEKDAWKDVDSDNRMALHYAAGRGKLKVAQIIIGAVPPELKSSVLNQPDTFQQTPLHHAVSWGETAMTEYLLASGSNVNAIDHENFKPIHYTAWRGYSKTQKILMRHGSNINDPGNKNQTPLHCAARGGNVKAAELLLNAGAEINALCDGDLTPLELATKWGHVEVATLLVNSGCSVLSKGSSHNRNLIQNIFEQCSDDKLQFAITIQSKYWGEIATEIRHMKTVSSNTKYYRYHYMVDANHYKMLKQWSDAIRGIQFHDLMKVPVFICTELDAAVKYRPVEKMEIERSGLVDSDLKKCDYYYQAFYNDIDDVGYYVGFDLLDSSDDSISSHPLSIIAQHDYRILLDHPVVRLYIRQKWSAALMLYIPFLLLFLIFTALMGAYVASTPPDITIPCSAFTHNVVIVWFLLIFSCIGILLEIAQIARKKSKYFSLVRGDVIHNLFDWFCYVSGIVIVIPPIQGNCLLFGDWMWTLGIIALFVSMVKFVQLTRIIPFLGIYVVMVEMILASFLRFCIVFAMYMTCFAVCFHLIIPLHTGFVHVGYSFVTTWVMMIGEMNYDTLVDKGSLLCPEWLVYGLFVIFLVVLSLIVMNLLTGIAVSDVQKLTEESTYNILKMQIEYSLSAERVFKVFRLKGCLTKLDSYFTCFRKSRKSGKITLRECDFISELPPPLHDAYRIIHDASILFGLEIKDLIDSVFYGPVNRRVCLSGLQKIKESKKEFWYVVPNIEWRKDVQSMTLDTTNILNQLQSDNLYLKKKLKSQEELLMEIQKTLRR